MPQTHEMFAQLASDNVVASLTVRRDGDVIAARASGAVIDGSNATSSTPMLVASVSKVVTMVGVARLGTAGVIAIDQPVPWDLMGLAPDPGWGDVTVRELLDHTSGMPIRRFTWFEREGDCRSYLPSLLGAPPTSSRGEWSYSNGNYCALGLLIEATTGQALDEALNEVVFAPLGTPGIHLSTNGLTPTDAPYEDDVARLSRLGAAGTFVVSTDDLSAMVASITPADLAVTRPPAVFFDQYGWGHTGTVSGAISCLWVLDDGHVTVAATIAGNSPPSGGALCDRVVLAVANDLGIGQGEPDRTP